MAASKPFIRMDENGLLLPENFAVWCLTADTLPTMVFTATPHGRVEFLNKRWKLFTGHEPSVALGNAWTAIIHPEDLDILNTAWRQSFQSGEEFTVEHRLRKADGSYAWVLTSAVALHYKNGSIIRWYGTITDIDARKKTEKALSEREGMLVDSERKFRALAEAIPIICWTADASGWVDWYNHRWYEYTGQTPEEAAGWGWQTAHHPDDFLEVMKQWPHSINTGQTFEMEFRLRRHDGIFHWFLTRVEPLRDVNGAIVRWYGSNVNIDAQKSALERTKRVAETLQDVFLPKQLPQKPNLRFDAIYLPAEKDAFVGGDWFDVFELPDRRLIFSIGDVVGHGLEASIIVGRIRQIIFTLAFTIQDPASLLAEVNRILCYQEPDTLVTALVGSIDPDHTIMQYASAGHPPPLIAYDNAQPALLLPTGGPPLGIDFERSLITHAAPIKPETVIAIYTDGMTEFSHDILAGEAKLRAAVSLMVGNVSLARPALAIKEVVLNGMPTIDDAALLLMQFSNFGDVAFEADPIAFEKTWRFHSSDAYTVHTSRQQIMKYLRRMAEDPEQVFSGELILGEILANTVEHAPGLVEVHIDWRKDKPIVFVRDTGPGLSKLTGILPTNMLDEDGRGIFLITALAEDASVKSMPGYGAEVRVTLPLQRKGIENNEVR